MNYFRIEGGSIVEGPKPLPRSWRNVSGLHLLSDERLAEHGWLPEEKVGFEPFDPNTEVREGPTLEVQADKVVATYTIRAMTQQELDDKQQADDLAVLRSATKDIGIVVLALVDALVAKGVIVADDVEPVARQAYRDLKEIADRVKS